MQRGTKSITRWLLVATVVQFGVSCSNDVPKSPVLVRVGDEVLTVADLYRNVPPLKNKELSNADLDAFINKWINSRILYRKGIEANIEQSQDIKKRVRDYEITLIGSAYLDSVLTENIPVSEAEAKKYYAENSEIFVRKQDAVYLKHVMFEDKKTADKESRALRRKRVHFDSLIVKYNPNKDEMTDLGFVTSDDIIEKFWSKVKGLDVGLSTRPIRTDYGYHIFKVIDRKKNGTKKMYKEVSQEIKVRRRQDKLEERYSSLLSQLKNTVKIETHFDVLKKVIGDSIRLGKSTNTVLKNR